MDQSVVSNTLKEVSEETGLTAEAEQLIAVQDWRRHNVQNYVYGMLKIFVECRVTGGKFEDNIETTERSDILEKKNYQISWRSRRRQKNRY